MIKSGNNEFCLSDILSIIKGEYSLMLNNSISFERPFSLKNATKKCLTFCSKVDNILSSIENTKSANIICCNDVKKNIKSSMKNLVFVQNPKLEFVRIINEIFKPSEPIINIHHTVIIMRGTIIGDDGFGFVKDFDGSYIRFPHYGNIVIEKNVEIGSNCCISRGTFDDTIIKEGAKLDNFIHIAHNCVIGKHSILTPKVMMGGGSKIGNNCYIHPGVQIGKKCIISDNIEVGMGSIVTKNLIKSGLYYGSPAKFVRPSTELRGVIK